MKIVLTAIGIMAILAVGVEIWSRIAYRRWRKRFDRMSPDAQRKEQERMYRRQQMA